MRIVPVELGAARTTADGCRRYRPVAMTFDTREVMLSTTIEDGWEPRVKELWRENKRVVREGLLHDYGVANGGRKIEDFIALGPAPWSVTAMHNEVMRAVRDAFVAGAYYPALLGAAGLGERILNQLVLELRDDYQDHPQTRRVAKKSSIDDWTASIEALRGWGVLAPTAVSKYKRLHRLRIAAVHYVTPTLDQTARAEALEAIRLLQEIVQEVFSPHTGEHYIEGTAGVFFVRLEAKSLPFVRRFLVPASTLVSPHHELDFQSRPPRVLDDANYATDQGIDSLTDEEFAQRVG